MKKIKKMAVRVAVAFFLLSAVIVVIETKTGANKAQAEVTLCGVTDTQCVNYLIQHGYTNVSIRSYSGCNRICDTSNSYDTQVDVTDGQGIVGSHDLPNNKN